MIQRGHSGNAVFGDVDDRSCFLAALREAAATEQVQLHAYALLDSEVHLLARPTAGSALSRMMQSVGRRYVSAHHRRYGGSGTLWEGRFRCAVVEPGPTLLDVMVCIDGMGHDPGTTSLGHRAGGPANPMLVDPPEYWQLGNTPFERQACWQRRVAEGLGSACRAALFSAALGNWAVGSKAFAAEVGERAARAAAPRPRGRPRIRLPR